MFNSSNAMILVLTNNLFFFFLFFFLSYSTFTSQLEARTMDWRTEHGASVNKFGMGNLPGQSLDLVEN